MSYLHFSLLICRALDGIAYSLTHLLKAHSYPAAASKHCQVSKYQISETSWMPVMELHVVAADQSDDAEMRFSSEIT